MLWILVVRSPRERSPKIRARAEGASLTVPDTRPTGSAAERSPPGRGAGVGGPLLRHSEGRHSIQPGSRAGVDGRLTGR